MKTLEAVARRKRSVEKNPSEQVERLHVWMIRHVLFSVVFLNEFKFPVCWPPGLVFTCLTVKFSHSLCLAHNQWPRSADYVKEAGKWKYFYLVFSTRSCDVLCDKRNKQHCNLTTNSMFSFIILF